MDFSFSTSLWLWNNGKAPASRHFLTVPKDIAEQITLIANQQPRKGRGSVKVKVRIGFFDWVTSIFPEKKTGTYLLPVKAEVRKELHIKDGDEVFVILELV